ncbi:fused MFS/spermidine synthase [Desulfovibrio sp.]|uniref:fused MFS/spermidine synthase n=1 Tax=Desulfovibrio sp. TaxID=885 RepID=UPI00307A6535
MLEIIAFCCGALVMVLEMVGARVLAPHVGTSAVVWTSLIGVVLACLAVGAWLGGRLADRHLPVLP